MIRTEGQRGFEIHHRITRQHATVQRFTNPLLHRRNKLARHHTALGGIFKGKTGACRLRFQRQHHVTILTFTARLAYKLAFHIVHRFTDGFAIGDLWPINVGFHAEFTLHAINDDLQMQLAHAGDNRLPRFFIGVQAE